MPVATGHTMGQNRLLEVRPRERGGSPDVLYHPEFYFSTPGWEASLGGFPALAVVPGQFLVKDVVLLGAALWSLVEALSTSR